MSRRKQYKAQYEVPLMEAWAQVKSEMSNVSSSFGIPGTYYGQNTTGGYVVNYDVITAGSSSTVPTLTVNQKATPPAVEVKPETHLEWLKLRTEEMCKEGRETLLAA